MPDVTEPKLNRRERWTREYILPLLPSGFNQPVEVGDEELEVVSSILAKQYVEHARLDVLWKTFVILLAYDVGFRLNSVAYGLVLGVLGSLALALTNMYTPELLAEEAFHKPQGVVAEIESKAEGSVKTNVGVSGLTVGFLWQIFSISGPIPRELLSQNLLQGTIPNWLGFIAVLFLGYMILGSGISDIRKRL